MSHRPLGRRIGARRSTGGPLHVATAPPPPVADVVYFDGSRFDRLSGTLLRNGEELRLRPKSADVLATLVSRPGEVVSKQALLEAVWPEGWVGDEVLAGCISELRSALGDNPRDPRLIATAHRRGYRFLAPVGRVPPADCGSEEGLLVGRDDEMAALRECWDAAQAGGPAVTFVVAPAGVGKSALVEAFVDQLQRRERVLVGHGRCVERSGDSEPYLPFLDALAGLCRGADGAPVVEALRTHAPLWMLRMPALLDDDGDALRLRTVEASPDRMMRELACVLEAVSSVVPIVLVCEDLHAADRASIELLSYLVRRPHRARLLVVGTYRPAKAAMRAHPVRGVVADLRVRPQCRYIELDLLTPEAVAEYLARRLAPDEPLPVIADEVYQLTDGNPLLMTMLVDHLVERDLLVVGDDGVRYRECPDRLDIPDVVRDIVEHQLDELAARDRSLLEIAAAIGLEFTSDAVLAAVRCDQPDLTAIEVDDRLDALARDVKLLVDAGIVERPDGTVTAKYRFRHSIHQQLLYCRLAATRRAAIHRCIGERLGVPARALRSSALVG